MVDQAFEVASSPWLLALSLMLLSAVHFADAYAVEACVGLDCRLEEFMEFRGVRTFLSNHPCQVTF